ncbi:hypothetical protein VTK73DRAFT_3063 [Phialemonium thermophilum]|uniref:Uncharacterized protein n=1 Tax=Phialemonium thermophilum TaxID=223376 RepID=A0ABR3VLZ5_9PEZI
MGTVTPQKPMSDHVEEGLASSVQEEGKEPVQALKLGHDGLPLVPQPSDHKDDPLPNAAEGIDRLLTRLFAARTGPTGTSTMF